MSIVDVVDVAAAQNREFRILGYCGPEGALIVAGRGEDARLWAVRGSPSGGLPGDKTPEYRYRDRTELRAALRGHLLKDGPCSELSVGYPGSRSWQFRVVLGPDGLVAKVEPTRPWE